MNAREKSQFALVVASGIGGQWASHIFMSNKPTITHTNILLKGMYKMQEPACPNDCASMTVSNLLVHQSKINLEFPHLSHEHFVCKNIGNRGTQLQCRKNAQS